MSYSAVTQFLGRLALIGLLAFIVVRVMFLSHSGENRVSKATTHPLPRNSASVVGQRKDPQAAPSLDKLSKALNKSLLGRPPRKMAKPIHEWDNTISRASMRWGDFVKLPHEAVRNLGSIPPSVLAALRQCPFSSVENATLKACTNIWNDRYLSIWKTKQVKDLCEPNANSRINCFDSPHPKSRYCIFENAMMNFKKVRLRKVDGQWTRSWEKGFLSADCGDMAPEDIGYLAHYKPDIDGRDDALCDFVFNETVALYSHDNIRSFPAMANDYLNLWAALWLSGAGRSTRDVSLFNLDAVRRTRYFSDQPSHFFRVYNASFRRLLRGVDWVTPRPARLCFKRLLLPPRPTLAFFTAPAGAASPFLDTDDNTTATCASRDRRPSSLFQRWNLVARHHLHLLDTSPSPSPTAPFPLRVLVISRSSSTSRTSRGVMANAHDVLATLRMRLARFHVRGGGVGRDVVDVVAVDVSALSWEDQVREMAAASVVVAITGSAVAASLVHMALGRAACCAVVEIFPAGMAARPPGYAHLARHMGHAYERLDVREGGEEEEAAANLTHAAHDAWPTNASRPLPPGSVVPAGRLAETVERVVQRLLEPDNSVSCVLPEVLRAPFL